ncbi:TolB family protein [Nibricoccus sp. IMCC34717]|uniref:TolB family protein n=1 Tax=Nibricoccus sp. IMCC34717 TaxID=3034021 RepID=UPI00384D12B5
MRDCPAQPLNFSVPLGPFTEHSDVGVVGLPGSASFDVETQSFTVEGSGATMWFGHDAFHFVHTRAKGDFILQALTEFVGDGVDPHRKVGLLIRKSLAPDSPHVNACRHGDGLMSLQFRRTAGGPTEEVRLPVTGCDMLQLERRGSTFRMSAARFGDTFTEREIAEIDLGDEVYVGLYVCAHNNTVSGKALLRNVRLIRPAPTGFQPYRDYIGSWLEVLDPATGQRRVLYAVDDSMQAPNWTTDGRALIVNRNGLLHRFDLATGSIAHLPTGAQVENNNDHALSFDGKWIGISSGQPSRVYVVPITGGEPRLLTPEAPSYLHGWSPDGSALVFTGGRNGNYDIYRISVDGGTEERLTTAPGLDDGSEYAPDGSVIFFNSERSGTMQLWRMKPDGSEQRQLTHDTFQNWFPHPSPDGKTLLFLSYRPEVPSGDHPFYKHVYLRAMPAAGGEPRVVAYLYGGQGSINVNSWSPDSKLVAFVSNTIQSPR